MENLYDFEKTKENKENQEIVKEIDVNLENLEQPIEEIEINVNKEKLLKERANKIFDAIIEDYQIGLLKNIKPYLTKYDEGKENKWFLKLKIKVLAKKDYPELEDWEFYEYLNIDKLVKYKKLHSKSKLFKIFRKYLDKPSAKIKDLKGLKVKVSTNEKGYGSILI